MKEDAIEAKNLVKTFGKIRALAGLSFAVRKGEIYGLIGPNGAGKTTALRIIATLITPTSGSVKVFGFDVERKASEVRDIISYLPEEARGIQESFRVGISGVHGEFLLHKRGDRSDRSQRSGRDFRTW